MRREGDYRGDKEEGEEEEGEKKEWKKDAEFGKKR